MHRFSLWLNVWEFWTFHICLFGALLISNLYLPHIHHFKRKWNNELIAEIQAIALGGSFICQWIPQHNIKKGDEATFTHVRMHRVAGHGTSKELKHHVRDTTHIFGIISFTLQLSSCRKFNPQVLSSLLKLTTWGWAFQTSFLVQFFSTPKSLKTFSCAWLFLVKIITL